MKNNIIDLSKFHGLVVAADKDKNSYYVVNVYSDGSAALLYDNGRGFGHWCSCNKLKSHLEHLSRLTKHNFIDNWDIVNTEFFKALNII